MFPVIKCLDLLLTCKLSVGCPSAAKLCHKLSVGLKDEDAAGFVINCDNVSVLIHCHTLRPHEAARSDLVLRQKKSLILKMYVYNNNNAP